MTWIELHDTVHRHPKTIAAAGLLRCSTYTLVGHLTSLWAWAIDSAPDGGPLSAQAIREGAGWGGRAEPFAATLAQVGYLDAEVTGLFYIHNWERYSGRLVGQRQAARDRAAKSRGQTRAPSAQRARTVRAPFASTVPDSTEPEPNQRDPTEINPPNGRRLFAKSTKLQKPRDHGEYDRLIKRS